MKDTTENYIELANAVLVKAIEDYRVSINYLIKHPKPTKNKYLECVKYINEVESFFNSKRSDFYTTSSRLTPKDLFKKYIKIHKNEIEEAKIIIEQNKQKYICKKTKEENI